MKQFIFSDKQQKIKLDEGCIMKFRHDMRVVAQTHVNCSAKLEQKFAIVYIDFIK